MDGVTTAMLQTETAEMSRGGFAAKESLGWGARLGASLAAARERLLSLQRPDGHWCAELEGDTILEAEYVFLMHYLGKGDDEKLRKAANYIRSKALPGGGWSVYPDGPAEVSASVKAYFVLKLLGDEPDAPHMRSARERILELGGLDATNSYTKLYLSIFGQYEWENAPAVPPELILFPRWFPFNIYEMSAWSRAIVVPLSIVWALKPEVVVPDFAVLDELRTGGEGRAQPAVGGEKGRLWARFFVLVDSAIKLLERWHIRPFRRRALAACEGWILERLRKSGGLGAIFPPIVNTIYAFDCLGYPRDHPVVTAQLDELEKLEIEEPTTLRLQPCFSSIWDTCQSVSTLAEAGLAAGDSRLARAAEWLIDREVTEAGDWKLKCPEVEPGGWYFEYANEFYPDCDDTAEVLLALGKLELREPLQSRARAAADRGLRWLLGMQNRDGGWGSFDRDCDREYLTAIPFADHNAMIDPSTSDITARVLEALARHGFDRSSTAVRRGVDFLLAEQEADGSWYGRWGCNYLYGTWLALVGLSAIGEDFSERWARKGAAWLRSVQNPDGGWGELPRSYEDPSQKGQGPSTAAQTAWALMGLMAVGEGQSPAVRDGLEYLLATQEGDGGWTDQAWTGTGFPEVFYLNYHYYALYFPLLALAQYREQDWDGSLEPVA
jgi:squalene-hopene/tetraprenyl-beta-curcumene cyclase